MPACLKNQVQTIKKQMEPKFLKYLQEILKSPKLINDAVAARNAARIAEKPVGFFAIDKKEVFDQEDNINPVGCKALGITFDEPRVSMATYNLEILKQLSFRERLILDSAISSAQHKLMAENSLIFETIAD